MATLDIVLVPIFWGLLLGLGLHVTGSTLSTKTLPRCLPSTNARLSGQGTLRVLYFDWFTSKVCIVDPPIAFFLRLPMHTNAYQ